MNAILPLMRGRTMDMPKNYTIEIRWLMGSVEKIECASHGFIEKTKIEYQTEVLADGSIRRVEVGRSMEMTDIMRIVTKDGLECLIPSSHAAFYFDENWTKTIEEMKKLREAEKKK